MKTTAEQMTLNITDVVTMISPEDLFPNPYQPQSRVDVAAATAAEFGASFERSGLIHFPVVRKAKADGKYEVGDGWLRRAGYLYNWKVQCLEKYSRLPCIVRELADQQMADLVIEANSERKDLNPLEWGEFYKKYLEEFKITQEVLGERFGKSQGEIANTMRLLELPAEVKVKIISHEITESHGRELLRLNRQPKRQQKILEDCRKNNLSVNDLSRRIESEIYQASKTLDPKASSWNNPPKFDVKACAGCRNVEKINKEFRCLDADCWQKKQKEALDAGNEDKLEKLKQQGIERLYESGELKYETYRRFYGDFLEKSPACRTCKHRAGIKSQYNDEIEIVCIDTECYNQKRKQEDDERRATSRKEAEEYQRRIEKAVGNCSDENLAMSSVIRLLGDYFDESLPVWFGVEEPEEGEDEHEFDIEAALLKKLDELNPTAMMQKLLGGLLSENRDDITESILERLENPAAAEKISPDARQSPGPDIEKLKEEAQEEVKDGWKKKALEAKFTKSIRCAGCGEQKHIEFSLDPEEKTEHHWVGACPKCGAKNSLKNKRWDGMMAIDDSGEENESA